MPVGFQIVIDCKNPDLLARFWAEALHYDFAPPPAGFDGWDSYWRTLGVPEEELDGRVDILVDPAGHGPRIQFLIVPEPKTLKNRLHFDLSASGGRDNPIETRMTRIDAEAERLVGLGAAILRVLHTDGIDHYAVAMVDPEGNEFDIN